MNIQDNIPEGADVPEAPFNQEPLICDICKEVILLGEKSINDVHVACAEQSELEIYNG